MLTNTLCELPEEKRMKQRIKELMRYRRNGITKMDGTVHSLLPLLRMSM